MLKQFDETIRDYLLNMPHKNHAFKDESEVLKHLYEVQRVRNTDYVIYFDSNGYTKQSKEIVTRANWHFILTNAACWFDVGINELPKLGIKFYDIKPNSPFREDETPGGPVLAKLDWGRENESLKHYEEYKNLFVSLGQRISIDVNLEPASNSPMRGAVILTGIEINLFSEA